MAPKPQRKGSLDRDEVMRPAGRLPDRVYRAQLSNWRFNLRKRLIASLEIEEPHLANLQRSIRTPWLDAYLLYASLLGTHSFFLLGLPFLAWFGSGEAVRTMVYAVGSGTVSTSYLKDLLCVPRPAAPPLERLSVGNHASEYGFPSTHSANTASIALVLAETALRHQSLDDWKLWVELALLGIYVVSVVGGRIICGMHSAMDCLVGFTMGAICWAVVSLFGAPMDDFCRQFGWEVPAVVISATLLVIVTFPEPVEDCPCFEDAVAFIAVMQGMAIGLWQSSHHGWLLVTGTIGKMHSNLPRDIAVFAAAVAFKVVFGIAAVLTWRILAKKVMHTILPPLIRLVQPVIELPRRHYRTASEYRSYKKTDEKLVSVPSVIAANLPEIKPLSSPPRLAKVGRLRSLSDAAVSAINTPQKMLPPEQRPQRRDADVITKIVVYTGIAYVAATALPAFYTAIGVSIPR